MQMNELERNILIGSLLGDGSLALYGRSTNAHYREHGGHAQTEYRRWNTHMLKDLEFKFSDKGKYEKIPSPSREIFTDLYHLFYIDRVKIVTKKHKASGSSYRTGLPVHG